MILIVHPLVINCIILVIARGFARHWLDDPYKPLVRDMLHQETYTEKDIIGG